MTAIHKSWGEAMLLITMFSKAGGQMHSI